MLLYDEKNARQPKGAARARERAREAQGTKKPREGGGGAGGRRESECREMLGCVLPAVWHLLVTGMYLQPLWLRRPGSPASAWPQLPPYPSWSLLICSFARSALKDCLRCHIRVRVLLMTRSCSCDHTERWSLVTFSG